MGITSAIVLFAVIWFMTLFVVLPLRLRTQGEDGEIVKGTHASAPSDPQLGKRALIVTAIAVPLWLVITAMILSGWITVEMLDVNGFLKRDDG